jgi:hypothetical protein
MRILFDHGTPKPLASFLTGHTVTTAKDQRLGQACKRRTVESRRGAGFDLLLTTDKNMAGQNPKGRTIALVVLGNSQWRLVRRIAGASAGSYAEVEIPFD